MLQVHGVPFSAHTRKVIVALREKDLAFELVRVIPLSPPPGWLERSPLGKIPVLCNSELTVADSSVICQYLERLHPTPSIYPNDPAAFARALWIEEFVDSGLAPHVLHGLLMQRVFAPRFLNRAPDEALIRRSLEEEIPPRLAYLERNLEGEFFAGGSFSVADLTVASMLINFQFAGERIEQYPKLNRYLQSLLRRPCFQRALAVELPFAEQIEELDLTVLRQALG
ncbi:MAG TPA: glutathione S-transferase family protein [Polyangiales bacterium]|nr:glutathione S-transferase family protein [Polyangiales bacterium]